MQPHELRIGNYWMPAWSQEVRCADWPDNTLATLNDEGLSFNKIADIIEKEL